MPSVVFAFGDSSKEVDLKDINSVEEVASNMKEVITMKTVKMEVEKFNDLIRYVEDQRAECIERDVEPSEDLKDAYEAISEIFNQLHH